jgi:HEAT repeat protein
MLVQAISSGNDRVRRWATDALSSPENANAALPTLLRVLEEDDQPLVLGSAAIALGNSQNPSAEQGLIAALRHSHPIVRTLAQQALETFDSPARGGRSMI